MPTESPRPFTRELLRVVFGTPDVADRDLLARFVASRDEEAFTEIVRRHGPMVLAVGRRVTGRTHDAEDAFQAAFLVLARRAAHIARPELLANWLYGVACRTAMEARAARRRAEERIVPASTEPAAPPEPDDTSDLRRVIDEELAKLPDKYRVAVVLCELEGLSRATAAKQLGIPEGTLSSRLAHARKMLAARLTRRGITASATALATTLSRDSIATSVPHNLTHITIIAAMRFAAGGAIPSAVSPAVSSLTAGVLKAMFVNRLQMLVGLGLLTCCAAIGLGAVFAHQPGTEPTVITPAGTFAPDLDVPIAQPKLKAAEPKKIAAKGIEDDDVPYDKFPTQAVVRIEEGKLIVRQRAQVYEPVTQNWGNYAVTNYQVKSVVKVTTHDTADIAVFDIEGNRLAPKAWREKLKSDVHALVAQDGRLPNPRELTLFKTDVLLIVLPVAVPPVTSVPPPQFVAPRATVTPPQLTPPPGKVEAPLPATIPRPVLPPTPGSKQ